VFVTGCDSGMGFWTAALLADLGYTVVAGCFLEDSEAKLKAHCKVQGVVSCSALSLNVSKYSKHFPESIPVLDLG